MIEPTKYTRHIVEIPLNYIEKKGHNGETVIKPCRPVQKNWQHIIKTPTIYEDQGIGIRTGRINNITGVDVDNKKTLDHLYKLFPVLRYCYTVKTPSGWHIYFLYYEGFRNMSFKKGPLAGVDIKNDNGFLIAPPSYQIVDIPSGQKVYYKVINESKPIAMPLEFIDYVSKQIEKHPKNVKFQD